MASTDCPHCNNPHTDIVEYAWNQNSVQYTIRFCTHCSCRYRLNRRNNLDKILVKGATPEEIRAAINNFAAAQIEAELSAYYRF